MDTGLVIFAAISIFLVGTEATLDLEISLVRYSNPNSEDCDGGNCESSTLGTCDNLFTFCLRTSGTSACSYEISSTNDIEDDDFSFTSSVLSQIGLSNPIGFRSIAPTAPLVLEIQIDDDDGLLNSNDRVDTIIINFPQTLNLSTTNSPTMSYQGTCRTTDRSVIDLQYSITSNCPENRYGLNCQTTCIPRVGQYYCNYLGDRVCQGTFTGVDCSLCVSNYYGEQCDVFCQPTGILICNDVGEHICGNGNFQPPPECNICLPNYYGTACDIECIPCDGQYNCNTDGTRECLGNFAGVLCDICRPNYYGIDCSIQCIPESSRFRCNSVGGIECNGNYVLPECTQCIPNYYGSTCNTPCVPRDDSTGHYICNQTDGSRICLRNFAGFDCLECVQNYYGTDCTLFCVPPTPRHVCSDDGPVCRGNYQLPDCIQCRSDYYGDTCSVFCQPRVNQYDCISTPPYRQCLGNFAAPDCTTCLGNFAGSTCTRCVSNFYTSDCSVFCEPTTEQRCNEEGELVDRNVEGSPPEGLGVGGYVGIGIAVLVLIIVLLLCTICCCICNRDCSCSELGKCLGDPCKCTCNDCIECAVETLFCGWCK